MFWPVPRSSSGMPIQKPFKGTYSADTMLDGGKSSFCCSRRNTAVYVITFVLLITFKTVRCSQTQVS